MRADVGEFAALAPQETIAHKPDDSLLVVSGPAGSGKTTALAMRASRLSARGAVAVVCANEASVAAFESALKSFDESGGSRVHVGTLAGHVAQWMRREYASAGVLPDLHVGSAMAARRATDHAARGLLDLSWPMFQSGDFNLDLPFLSRPERFLEEASALFRLLRRLRLTPDEFADGCSAGMDAFYGDGVEGAVIRLRDPEIRPRLSKRGSQACAASREDLSGQRRAERGLTKLLAQLYDEYVKGLPRFAEWCEEDVIAHGTAWLLIDGRAARAVARRYAAMLVDDAEDADPALALVVNTLAAAGLKSFTIAGNDDAQIEGMAGRRSALAQATPDAERMYLAPIARAGGAVPTHRFASEEEEADWLAASIGDLLGGGAQPHEIAVLSRSVDSSAVYRRLLAERGLPVLASSESFEAASNIADLLALAAIADDRTDHAHLLRVLSSPLLGLNDATVWMLCTPRDEPVQLVLDIGARGERHRSNSLVRRQLLSQNVFDGAADDTLSEEVRQRLAAFRERFAMWERTARSEPPARTIERLMHDAGFTLRWANESGHRRLRLAEDGERLVAAIRSLHETEPELRLRDAVCRIEDGEATIRHALVQTGGIVCDAIVASKGNRWPYVFVAGVAHERFPRIYNARGMAFSRNFGLLVRENVAGPAAQTAKFAWFYAKFDAKGRYLAQERTILRYGLSRANAAAVVTGFGRPPHWARDFDLLAELGA